MIYDAIDWLADLLCSVITGYTCEDFLSRKREYEVYPSKYTTVYNILDSDDKSYWDLLLTVAINQHLERAEINGEEATLLDDVESVCKTALDTWEAEMDAMLTESQLIILKAMFPQKKDFDRVYNGEELLAENLTEDEKSKLVRVATMLNKLWEQGQSPLEAARDTAARISDF